MATAPEQPVRLATAADSVVVATMLDDFNREFDTPTPGAEVLAARLGRLLGPEPDLMALLGGEPAVGLALMSFRPTVWAEGPVATLDELYVRPGSRNQRIGHALLEAACRLARDRRVETFEINVDGADVDARRFYEAHGFVNTEPGATEPMLCYYRDLE